ncbi:MAG: acyl-CoA thioesterase [Syntrophales bacterium]
MFGKIITPRISETNITGHIGHTVIPVWLEEGYEEIIQLFSRNLAEPSLITVNMNMDFLHEIFFGKDVEILTSVKKIGTSSFVLHQEVYQGGELCVRASTTLVHFNYSTHKPDPIPKNFLRILKEHVSVSS